MSDQEAKNEASTAAAAPLVSETPKMHQNAEEQEPRLSFNAFGADVAAVLNRESATCLCVSDKLLALGTQSGAVYLLDYEGNKVKNFQEHSAAVTDLSFDADAETLASSSLDGYVTTYNLYTNDVQRFKCRSNAVTTVTLDPRHSHRKTKEFVYGTDTGTLLLSSKGWLGNTETILFQGRGPVLCARMAGTLLAWATESGLRVYNTADHSRIGKVDRPTSTSTDTRTTSTGKNKESTNGIAKCSLTWVGDKELLVGWGRHVMVLEIVHLRSTTAVPPTPSTSTSTPPPSSINISTPSSNTADPVTPRQMSNSSAPAVAGPGTPSSSSRQFTLHVVSEFEIPQKEESENMCVVGVAAFGRHLAVLVKNNISSTSTTTTSSSLEGKESLQGAVFKVFDRSGNELFTDPIILDTSTTADTATTSNGTPDRSSSTMLFQNSDLLGFTSFYSLDDIIKEKERNTSSIPLTLKLPSSSSSSSLPSKEEKPLENYKWWSAGAEPVYFIISSKSITLGHPRTATDRIAWLVHRHRYLEAVQIAESDSSIDENARVQLGEQYLHYLIGTESEAMDVTTPRTETMHNATSSAETTSAAAAAAGGTSTAATEESTSNRISNNTVNKEKEREQPKKENVKESEVSRVEKYKMAADLTPRLLRKDASAWERWVYIFGQAAQLPLLAPKLPTSDPVLSRDAYDMVLTACLQGSFSGVEESMPAAHDMLRDLVERWPHGIYDARALINQLQPRIEQQQKEQKQQQQQQRPTLAKTISTTPRKYSTSFSAASSVALKRAAASLHAQLGQHEAALRLLLELRSPSTFDYIKTNALQALAANFAAELIDLDEVKATQMLVEAVEEAPPAAVVASLQAKIASEQEQESQEIEKDEKQTTTSNEKNISSSSWSLRLYHYLDWLWQKEEITPNGTTTTPGASSFLSPSSSSSASPSASTASFAQLHIELCAVHDPDRLMHILTTSSSYPLDAALQVCESHGLVRESVYLLGRMGSSDAALRLIVGQLRDVEGAVTFVQDSRDDELWELLISLTLGDAALTGALLDHAGGSVDPLRLVEAIPENIKIERLRDRLVRVITDFRATVSLQSGCNAVLRTDCLELGDKLYDELRRALKTLFILKPGGRWSTLTAETITDKSGGVENGGDSGIRNNTLGGQEGFPLLGQVQFQHQHRVWIGSTSTNTNMTGREHRSGSRKMSLTPPPSVHTSPSKFPPARKNTANSSTQQRTVGIL